MLSRLSTALMMTRHSRRLLVAVPMVLATTISISAPLGATPPGNLPQTSIEPNFTTGLNSQMHTLWRAISLDSPAIGERVFFPREAYLRMKQGQIVNPASDYSNRLIALFALDVGAYHRLMVMGVHARFERIVASRADAAWIPPGACENRIGYWHLPGVRLVFARGRHVESVAVASLISWRGVWYVVHLGPNPRSANVGTVDGYRSGPGTPGPAGGC